jgi:manganese-transporting P-type ATPase
MIITIAVNSSLLLLQKKNIFCTEPHRIPMVGKITVCAFDKTGTLTSDSLLLKGCVDPCSNSLLPSSQFTADMVSVLTGCHSLIVLDKQLLGDPIEKLFFEQTDWYY